MVPKKDIQLIDLRYLLPYEGQPFKPYTNDRLQELAEDIKVNGVLSPVIVRRHPDQSGMYQILAGHNRIAACKLLGWKTDPVVVKDVDDLHAQLIMVNSNLNRRQELLLWELFLANRTANVLTRRPEKKSFIQTKHQNPSQLKHRREERISLRAMRLTGIPD